MILTTYQLRGIIQYYNSWALAWVASELDRYYRALLPKAWYVQPPMNKPHISIVRSFEEPNRDRWGEYEGKEILIDVFDGVQTDGLYFWLDCFSDEVGYIRRSLGLPTFRENDGWSDYNCYHITIGNVKNEQTSGEDTD